MPGRAVGDIRTICREKVCQRPQLVERNIYHFRVTHFFGIVPPGLGGAVMEFQLEWHAVSVPVPADGNSWAVMLAALVASLLVIIVLSNPSRGKVWHVRIKTKEWDNDPDPNKERTIRMKQKIAFNAFSVDKNSRTRGVYVWKQALPFTRTASVILRAYKGLEDNELQMHAQVAEKLGLIKIDPYTDEIDGKLEQEVRLHIGLPLPSRPWFALFHPDRDVARDYRLFAAGLLIPLVTPVLTALLVMWWSRIFG